MRRVLTVLGVIAGLMLAALAPALAAGDAEVGMVDTGTGRWHLREPNGSDRSFFYGNPGDIPLLGDWNCDGVDTPGMFRPGNGFFYLTNANPPNGGVGIGEISFFFGIGGDLPMVGDWDGDGCDSVGIYRNGQAFLTNGLATAVAEIQFYFGVPGDRPFAGDWDGDGTDTVGIYRNSSGQIFYSNENPAGPVATTANDFFYGIPSDRFMPGDWDGDGIDTVGIYRSTETRFYLRNTNSTGPADETFDFGQSSWTPLGGDHELREAALSAPASLDLGPVGLNGSGTANLALGFAGDGGDADLEITEIDFLGGAADEFSVAPLADPNIGFGETRTLEVTLVPDVIGLRRSSIRIAHTGAGSPLVIPLVGESSHRVNAGGDPIEDWVADDPFSPGGSVGPPAGTSVSGPTAPDEVFESYRFGQQAWDFAVIPGAYQVNLYFAETFPGTQSAGARQFDVTIEGTEVLTNFDIFAAAGANNGMVRTFEVISDGNLDIDFTQVVNSPAVQGIEVIPAPVANTLGSSPAEVTFGSTAVGDSIFRTVNIVHLGEPGSSPLNLQTATIVGNDSNQFGFISGLSARQLQPGQISAIVMGFSPSRAGVADARLHIDYDGADSPIEVDLVAAGDDVILYRLNAGGDAVIGQFSWIADDPYIVPGTPSGEFALVEAINVTDQSLPPGTPLDVLRTERFGSSSQALSYDLPLADGAYEVRLYMVEPVHTAAGVRVFDVNVEGALAINDLDIYARAGKNKAIMIPIRTNVTGGVLDIDLIPIAGKNLPAVHGIEVVRKVGNAILGADPVSLTLGPISATGTTTGELEIVHTGGAGNPSIVIDSVTIGGANAGRFALLSGPQAGDVFPPGISAPAVIQFTAGWPGEKLGSLVIVYNGGSGLTVPLVGAVNDPPVVPTLANQSVNEGVAYSRTIVATDPDPDFLTMTVSGLPGWASVTAVADGTITVGGTPGFGDAGASLVTVTATDPNGLADAESFTLTVANVNRAPTFNQNIPNQTNTEGDTVSISSEATDLDGNTLTWSASGLPQGVFINPTSGLISGTMGPLAGDNQPGGGYSVVVTVRDNGSPNLTDTDAFQWFVAERFTLTVIPSGDGAGTVTSSPTGISCGADCSELYDSGGSVTVTAVPAGGSSFSGWTGAGCVAAGTGPCTIVMSANLAVTAIFGDINDAPSDIGLTSQSVPENFGPNGVVGLFGATDPDGPGEVFSLVAGPGSADNGLFNIAGTLLRATNSLDAETQGTLSIRVRVDDTDGGIFEKQFTITVTNVNEAPTDIALSSQSVAENAPVGTPVGTISSSDVDGPSPVYTLESGAGSADNALFNVVGNTLQTAALLSDGTYSVRIQVDDTAGGTFQEQFTITVTNVNVPPSDIGLTSQSVPENFGPNGVVGLFGATDPDGPGEVFSLVAGPGSADNGLFNIAGTLLRATNSLDAETQGTLSIRVRVDDTDGGIFEKQFTITVTNVNEAPTDIALSSQSVAENAPVGTPVGTISSSDVDGPSPVYTLESGAGSADNALFNVVGNTLQTAALLSDGTYSVRIQVDDTAGGTFQEQFTITVTNVNVAPSVTAPVDQTYTVGVGIAPLVITGSDTDGTIVTTAVSALPAGLSTTGGTTSLTIVGTPTTAAGALTVTVTVTDNDGATGTDTFTITVNAAPNVPPSVTAPVDQTYTVGVGIAPLVITGSDTDGTIVTTAVSALPAGLSTTGGTTSLTIVGTPTTAAGALTVTVTVTDNDGATGTDTFTITVNAAPNVPPSVTAPVDQTYTVGVGIAPLVITGSDTDGTIVTTAVSALPAGLSTTGGTTSLTIVGTPTTAAGALTVTVTVTDNDGATGTDTFTITVNAAPNVPPSVTAPVDQTYTVGVGIAPLVITGSDTDGTIVTTAVSALPAGLSTTGGTTSLTIVGTPTTAAGALTVTVTVTDNDGATGTDTFTITVNAAPNVPPSVTAPVDQTYTVGVGIAPLVITGSDTDGTIVTTAVSALPAGLSTTGGTTSLTIVGTPTTAAGALTVTVTVTDNDGATGTDTFTITVNAAPNVPPSVTAPVDQTYTVGVGIAPLVITGSDTDGTIVTTAVSALPAGLSTTGGTTSLTIVGTPTTAAGALTVTVTVTDNDGATGTDTFTITVNAAPNVPPSVTAPVDQTYTVGVGIAPLVITGSDTDGTIVTTAVSALPAGLSTTGGTTSLTIVGTPTTAAGALTVTVTVTDNDGATGTDTFTITVIN